ncbi:MAG: peptide deformylase [Sphingobacteriales bacterium]|nr:MAG: peptide deformylase [Sphingobacteriales bacterium]
MIYPIVIYGDPVLNKRAEDIKPDYPELPKLIDDMFETMYAAHGVGLAAPQIGKSIRLFVVDGSPMDEENLADFKKVFINPEILEESEEEWKFEEGCLSIPNLREKVERPEEITLRYQDENFKEYTEVFDGIKARIIQHEYDHIEGILFTEHLSAFKKSLIKGKLSAISKGEFERNYPVKVYSTSKKRK